MLGLWFSEPWCYCRTETVYRLRHYEKTKLQCVKYLHQLNSIPYPSYFRCLILATVATIGQTYLSEPRENRLYSMMATVLRRFSSAVYAHAIFEHIWIISILSSKSGIKIRYASTKYFMVFYVLILESPRKLWHRCTQRAKWLSTESVQYGSVSQWSSRVSYRILRGVVEDIVKFSVCKKCYCFRCC